MTERTELGQAVDVIVDYLCAHPEKRQVNAASMAIVALVHARSLVNDSHFGQYSLP